MNPITNAAELAGLAASAGAHRAGLPAAVAEFIGNAISDVVKSILTHKNPEALARDLAAEAVHRSSTYSVIQAALDEQGGRHE